MYINQDSEWKKAKGRDGIEFFLLVCFINSIEIYGKKSKWNGQEIDAKNITKKRKLRVNNSL